MKPVVEISVGTYDAKNTLSALVDLAARGGRIWITKRGKRVALLTSAVSQPDAAAPDPVASLRGIRKRSSRAGGAIRDLIAEGRR